VEGSRASAQASAADIETLRLSVQGQLAVNYFQLRALDAQRQLLDATIAAYGKSLDLTKNRYAGGVASKTDVAQADTQLKSTQAQALDTGVQRAQLEHAVALLVGKPASTFSIPVAPLAAVPPAVPVGVPSEVLERRPDIAAAERRVAAANAQIGVAQAAFYPSLMLSASGGFESANFSRWLTLPSRFWALGPALAQTLFDGGLRRAQTEQARAAYDATVAAYRQTVLAGFQEVEDNLAALRILEQESRVQDEALRSARESMGLALNQYKAGTIDYLSVVIVQAALLTNERTAVDILNRRMAASVQLVKALGGGWDLAALPGSKEVSDNGSRSPAK
jgi:NodT family efflux transporter outer membrane factor (OMF) lipoprotein